MELDIGLSAWRLHGTWEQRIAIAAEHGLSALHIDMGGPGRDTPFEDPDAVLRVTREANRKGLDVRVLAVNRLNDIGLSSTLIADRIAALQSIEIAICCASAAGIPYVMIPIFKRSVPVDQEDISEIAAKLRMASEYAEAFGVRIVCENILADQFLADIEQQIVPCRIGMVYDCLNPVTARLDPVVQWKARRMSAIPDVHVKDQDTLGHHVELGKGIGGIENTISELLKDMPSPLFILEGDYFTFSQDRINADIVALNQIITNEQRDHDVQRVR
ncbi:sugar phosphate isomerase/epimerase [Agrobacterium rhizogenes]|nr:sugar phosphate isomerase/epimerase [Rhizobium rhizogenes]NTF78968.1 sugar phosphate isomerase/epimerase [Rhizobium rhizogenes]